MTLKGVKVLTFWGWSWNVRL